MPEIEAETIAQKVFLSQTVVDALSGLRWLTNIQRLDIAEAMSPVFVASPRDPTLATIQREALEDAVHAVREVDHQYQRARLGTLSGERMALSRAISAIEDLIQRHDSTKRSAGVLGWRKKELLP